MFRLLVSIKIHSHCFTHPGAKNLDNCPAEKYIPIYLVVMGSFSVFRNIIGLANQIKQYKNKVTAVKAGFVRIIMR